MRNICSLLIIMCISASSLAAGVKDNRPPLKFQGIDGDLFETGMDVHERYLLFEPAPRSERTGILDNVSLLIERQRLPMLGETIPGSGNFTIRNKVTLTYRFSDQTTLGVMREGALGRGVGFEYAPDRHTDVTVWGAFLRSPDYGERIPMIGIKFLLR